MKKKFRLGLLALLALPAVSVLAEDPQQKALVMETSAGKVAVTLDQNPEITFRNGADGSYIIHLSYNDGQYDWSYGSINGWYFSKGGNSGIAEAVSREVEFCFNAASETIRSSVEGIAVFDLTGRQACATDGTELSVAGLCGGMYIAVSGTKTVKFIKR